MDLNSYRQKKIKERARLDEEWSKYRDLCLSCFRPRQICFCSSIRPFNTYFTFRILMHPKEAKREHVGTGRLANAALDNCEIIIGSDFDQHQTVQELINSPIYFPMLLYPGKNSINLSSSPLSLEFFNKRMPLLFIIDGTWAAAKAMMRESKTLHHLPRLSFDPTIESKFAIKQQPQKFCLSTIESIYYVLRCLESHGLENIGTQKEVLLESLAKLVNFQIKCASDPTLTSYRRSGPTEIKQYKDPSSRIPSKRWMHRKVCFDG